MDDCVLLAPTGSGGQYMACRARLFVNEPFYVVIFTDIDGDANPGMSITNGVEYAARAFVEAHPEIPATRAVWIEHYDDRQKRAAMLKRYGPAADRMLFAIRDEHGESFDLVTSLEEPKQSNNQGDFLCQQ
jgi:hypothetical protein